MRVPNGRLDLESILAQSHYERPDERIAAIKGMRRFIAADPVSFSRLTQMLADPIAEVAAEAAEALVEDRGYAGLEAVLDELGRRVDDPALDAIANRLEVLETTRRFGCWHMPMPSRFAELSTRSGLASTGSASGHRILRERT